MVVADAVVQRDVVVGGGEPAGPAILGEAPSLRCAEIVSKAIQVLAACAAFVHEAPVGVRADSGDAAGTKQARAAGAAVADSPIVPGVAAATLVSGHNLAAGHTNMSTAPDSTWQQFVVTVDCCDDLMNKTTALHTPTSTNSCLLHVTSNPTICTASLCKGVLQGSESEPTRLSNYRLLHHHSSPVVKVEASQLPLHTIHSRSSGVCRAKGVRPVVPTRGPVDHTPGPLRVLRVGTAAVVVDTVEAPVGVALAARQRGHRGTEVRQLPPINTAGCCSSRTQQTITILQIVIYRQHHHHWGPQIQTPIINNGTVSPCRLNTHCKILHTEPHMAADLAARHCLTMRHSVYRRA